MEKTEKKKKFPDVYVILVVLAAVAALLTWIIPAGQFERITEGSITRVIPGSFVNVEQNGQTLWDVFRAIVSGFKAQASLITMTLFVGATVYILQSTKAIDVAFKRIAAKVKGREEIAIFFIMLFMTIGGAAGVFGSVTLVLIPIGIFLSLAMGFDRTLGFAMIFFGSFSGFNVGWANFGTIGIAQTIAEIPIFSGIEVRLVIHVIIFLLNYGFVILYLKKLRKDPTNSLNYIPGMSVSEYMGNGDGIEVDLNQKFTKSQIFSLLAGIGGIVTVIIGAVQFRWGADHISATFLCVAIIIGFVSGLGANGTAQAFIKGCTTVVTAAFIIGFANAITILMSNGKILDTIVYYLSNPINRFGDIAGANFMLLSNVIVNIFISSGSGQATAVMPIMVPIADLTGITRQVAVQAYQFGDGFTNCLHPTVGSLMGGLGFAMIPYNKYLKWAAPFILLQVVIAFIAITILQAVQWTGY